MSTSEVSICNLAVSWLAGNVLTSLEFDESVEASLCRTNYENSRDAVLEDRDWSFAIARTTLAPTLPAPDYGFSNHFTLPSEVIRVLKVGVDPTFNSVIDWEKEGNTILLDSELAYVKYIAQIKDVTLFSKGFIQALAAHIAMSIAIPVTGSKEMQQLMVQLYGLKLNTAGTMDGMQGRNRSLQMGNLLRVR